MKLDHKTYRLVPLAATYAELDLEVPATQLDTVIQAVAEGAPGSLVTIAAVADSDSLETASLDLDTVTGDLDTIIEAATAGADGNDITITVVGDSGAAEGVTIDEVGNAVTIHFEDGVSTVGDVETAIAGATLIAVRTAGTGATVLDAATDECTDESLAGGVDAEGVYFEVSGTAITCHFEDGVSTVADFEAALEADDDVSALISIKTAGTGAAVLAVADDDFSATALTGGGATTQSAPTVGDSSLGEAKPFSCDAATILVRSAAGSGTMTATVKVWGYNSAVGYWSLVKALNGGSAIPETSTDRLAYAEVVTGLRAYSRVHVELAVAGTGTEVDVTAVFHQADALAS